MDVIATEMLNSVESVADETIKVDSVAEPSRPVKKPKSIVKDCKVLYWNKDSRNIAFQYEDKKIQIVLSEPLKKPRILSINPIFFILPSIYFYKYIHIL